MDASTPAFLGVASSLTGRLWRPRLTDERLALALTQRLGVPEVIGRLLAARGVDLDNAATFLNPTLKAQLPNPAELLDMERAVTRIVAAIEASQRICVFGDYDVDGATSASLLMRYFSFIGRPIRLYVPDRQREGYGPNAAALQRLAAEGVKLVITVDCGTLAFAPLAAAASENLDVVVVDHHLAEAELPAAVAVVNPNRLDETSPHRQVAAVGVVFLLLVALNRALKERGYFTERAAPDLLGWLDLVALGTICDVVPLTGVNRAFVTQGLKVLTQRRNPGLAALADVAGLQEPPGAYHCGYLLGPRVNAGGRVGRSDLGARLLSTDDPAEAARLAGELDRHNRERQAIEGQVLEDAMAQLAGMGALDPVVTLAGNNWHPGVIGIIAARVREATDRPSMILAIGDDGLAKGSGRSIPGVDLGAAVVAALQAGLLVAGGGHAMAAGLTVAADRIDDLKSFLNLRLAGQVEVGTAVKSLGIDASVGVGGANRELLKLIDRVGPFGSGNAEPRLALPNVRIVEAALVGERHVRMVLTDQAGQGRLKAIAFRAVDTPLAPALLKNGRDGLHLAGHLRADNWRGEQRVQLVVDDAARPNA